MERGGKKDEDLPVGVLVQRDLECDRPLHQAREEEEEDLACTGRFL